MSQYISEYYHYVPILSDGDFNAGVNLDTDSINMANYHHASIIVSLQDIGVASPVMYWYSGATNAAMTSPLTFNYAFGGAAQGTASCDVLAAWATSAGLTLTHGTYDNYMLVVEIPATIMDLANDEEWLTGRFVDPGGATGNVSVTAILTPRYKSNRHPTALT